MKWFYKQIKWIIKWKFLKTGRASKALRFIILIAPLLLLFVTWQYVQYTKRLVDITHDQFIQNSMPEISIYSKNYPEVVKSDDTLLFIPVKNFSKLDLIDISGGVSLYCYIINDDGTEAFVEFRNFPDERFLSNIISLKAGEVDTLRVDITRYRNIDYENEHYYYISLQLGGSGEWRKMRLLQYSQCLLGKIKIKYRREIDGKIFKKIFHFTSAGAVPKFENSGYFVVDDYDETISMWRKFSQYFLNKDIWKKLQQESKKHIDSFKTK